jgi:hypothetical protein
MAMQMRTRLAAAIAVALAALYWAPLAAGQSAAAGGPVPAALQPPATAVPLLRAKGQGVQIYGCTEDPDGSGPAWTLKAPDAVLYDEAGKPIGKHFAGPSWQANDGSKVVGELLAHAKAPSHDAIPWLLLKAQSREGSGLFADVSFIQRVDTGGGLAPSAACDTTRDTAVQRVPYTATYVFYRDKP